MSAGALSEMNRVNENLKERRPMFYSMKEIHKGQHVKIMKSGSPFLGKQGMVTCYYPNTDVVIVTFNKAKGEGYDEAGFRLSELLPTMRVLPNRLEPDN